MDFSWSSFLVGLVVGVTIALLGAYYIFKKHMEKKSQNVQKLLEEQQIEIARSFGLSEVQINRIKQQFKAKKKKNKSNN
jgi:uncharacterized membrane-anchored protein YhcB (DUF1043 family)